MVKSIYSTLGFVFSVKDWDGLAKIGTFKSNSHQIKTPALFPVVDPKQQSIPIQDFKDKFGFTQVISSAYLMSKRIGNVGSWDNFPKMKDYLNYDGLIMMDSGAYQVMLYGDIELGVTDTLTLQKTVQTDIGVIMDEPIGYSLSFEKAKMNNQKTISQIKDSLPHLTEEVMWTLPIQGGKYPTLIAEYIDQILELDYLDYFSMFALGSVVPVMINQDYESLVKMIGVTRRKLPITYPLHLFGAGHPAMFALATFLGCDTFDSAAYSLMAKDDRYMTEQGTFNLNELKYLPCSCPICSSYTSKELQTLDKTNRINQLQAHNLYVSQAEIRRIRTAIEYGRLWDLVQQRANAVPRLSKATRLAFQYVKSGKLGELLIDGSPISRPKSIRISNPIDLQRGEFQRIKSLIDNYLKTNVMDSNIDTLYLICYSLEESIYQKFPENQLKRAKLFDNNRKEIIFWLPPFGFVPFGMNELFPIGQSVHDLFPTDFHFEQEFILLSQVISKIKEIKLIFTNQWLNDYPDQINQASKIKNIELIETEKPMATLMRLLN